MREFQRLANRRRPAKIDQKTGEKQDQPAGQQVSNGPHRKDAAFAENSPGACHAPLLPIHRSSFRIPQSF